MFEKQGVNKISYSSKSNYKISKKYVYILCILDKKQTNYQFSYHININLKQYNFLSFNNLANN